MEEELNSIRKELIRTQIIGAPGMILVGLGLYGAFGAKGNAFHPFLNDLNNCYTILAVGGAIAVWEAIKVAQLTKRQSKLNKQQNR
ncbi:hypothetical protein [Rheinheimera soli]|uniref:hypothetical protein n=1 Tax=Rheinheimera soli TaxID=443616 RepID=UPI001E3D16D5|nr:hypothetical protein [Rheinheimera soli]